MTHRFAPSRLLALVLGLATVPACTTDSATGAPPGGTIRGVVRIEGVPVAGFTITLAGAGQGSVNTGSDGAFTFTELAVGSYTLTLSGGPVDARVEAATKTAAISSAGETVTVDFTGTYERSVTIQGEVRASGVKLADIAVGLDGPDQAEARTDADGLFFFGPVRAGTYTVTISGFDAASYVFPEVSATFTAEPGDMKFANFSGEEASTATLTVEVRASGDPVAGMTVFIQQHAFTATLATEADGVARFPGLRRGPYVVELREVSDEFAFTETETSVTIDDIGGSAEVTFEGVWFRIAWAALAVGARHTCALDEDGVPYCWGRNEFGELGDGTRESRTRPVPVAGGRTFDQIFAGAGATCGLTAAGAAWCWGGNGRGQLGDGTSDDRLEPVAVTGGHQFVTLAIGDSEDSNEGPRAQTCGITAAGAAYCWGHGRLGGRGDGTRDDASVPVAVDGNHVFVGVTAGSGHTCGVTDAGEGYCWGLNAFGQVGSGTADQNHLSPVLVANSHIWQSISAYAHTCGVTATEEIRCWGGNDQGRLGLPTATTEVRVPTLVADGYAWSTVSAGNISTCAVTAAGEAHCWGFGGAGALGDGTTTGVARPDPAPVVGGHRFASVGVGFQHGCGRTTEGAIYCWGFNLHGQVGNTTTINSGTPTRVWDPE